MVPEERTDINFASLARPAIPPAAFFSPTARMLFSPLQLLNSARQTLPAKIPAYTLSLALGLIQLFLIVRFLIQPPLSKRLTNPMSSSLPVIYIPEMECPLPSICQAPLPRGVHATGVDVCVAPVAVKLPLSSNVPSFITMSAVSLA